MCFRNCFFTDDNRQRRKLKLLGRDSQHNINDASSKSRSSSVISASHMKMILEKLLQNQNRDSTSKTYLHIWRQFNSFVINLDVKSRLWEDRTSLFIAHLVYNKGVQSSTVKTYVSAIKRILVDDGYFWNQQRILLNALTKTCRLVNDRVFTRLPIQCGLLELMLFEFERMFQNGGQIYLEV